jgi:3-oxoacyl-[acyl-carrier-protein] synthase II
MTAYINGTGLISPQKTAEGSGFLDDIVVHHSDFFKCLEPEYRKYLDPMAARRLNRLIKMGITSAKMCLADARIAMPDAIITGTGMGSLDDVEAILEHIDDDTVPISPTPFMQSTYNTISSQIAIHLKCHGYNSTYVHRSHSLETSLTDAMIQLDEGAAVNVLVGGIDEMISKHYNVIRRLGHWKMIPVENLHLLDYQTQGAVAGEGSGHFLLSSQKTATTYAAIQGLSTFYKPQNFEESRKHITGFLDTMNTREDEIDLFLTGLNGDTEFDPIYYRMAEELFPERPLAWFKHLSGEFCTATLFSLWAAANSIKRQEVPPILLLKNKPPENIRKILIYNQYRNLHHSLMLIGRDSI